MNSSTDRLAPPGTLPTPAAATLAGRMQSGVALNLLGAACNQGSTFLVNLAVANLLGRESFGHYTMIAATVATVATLGQLSMGYTATKHVAEYRLIEREKTSRILVLCGVVSCVAALSAAAALALAARWLASDVLGEPALAHVLRISAAAVFFSATNGFFTGALAGLESYRAIAVGGIASGIVYATVCTAFAWTGGLSGAVTGIALSVGVQSIILASLLRREALRSGIPLTPRGFWKERGIVSSFAIPASLTGVVALPAAWIGTALLARQPGGFAELALFGAANSFRVIVLFIPQGINSVSMSLLNNQRRAGGDGYRRVFWMNTACTIGLAVVAAGLVLIAWSPLLRLFGGDFEAARSALTILLGAAILEAAAIALYQIVVSHGRMWASLFLVSLPRDLTLVLLAALLTPALGAAGLATAYAVGWTLSLIGTVALVSRLGLAPLGEDSGIRR